MSNLKTKKLTLLKKGRVWIGCKNESGYDCKLKINALSDSLTLNQEHELLVDDISVRSKYGTDLRYEVKSEDVSQRIFLQHFKYNSHLVEACKKLGGIWDKEANAWVFCDFISKEVDDLEKIYNSELVTVEITASNDCYFCRGPLRFCGYTICSAKGRDTGATLAPDVSLIEGSIRSAGSSKNWTTEATEGSVFRLNVPICVLEKYREYEKDDFSDIKIIKNNELESK